jgi:hypothetical protein
MARVHLCLIVPLLYPVAVVLSVCSGVGGCGCPISSNVVRNIPLPLKTLILFLLMPLMTSHV